MIMSDSMPATRRSVLARLNAMQKRAQNRSADEYVAFVRGAWPPSSISCQAPRTIARGSKPDPARESKQ